MHVPLNSCEISQHILESKSIIMMSWGTCSMDLLLTIVFSVSKNVVQAATLLGHDQATQARLPLSVPYKGDVCSGILDPLRDSGSQRCGLNEPCFSTSSRRLLQAVPAPPGSSQHKSLSRGGIIACGIIIPLITIAVVLAMVIWYLRRRRRDSKAKSPPPPYTLDEASTTNSRVMPCKWASWDAILSMVTKATSHARRVESRAKVGLKGFRSWMKSCSAPSGTKPKDSFSSTETATYKHGFGPWMERFWVSPKPKIYLSSACEMDFSKLQAATDNFSKANLLGAGGSGYVYRAKLDGGDYGAVKIITAGGRNAFAEFQAEVDLMRQVRHPNLVSLLGYCNQGERRLLVYELMRNGSLEDQLYGPKQGTGLSWFRRIKIALDSARGLEYLHENCHPPVVHRDFKASNILLDENLNAKISDFGLATPLEGLTQEESLQLVGTIGYVAPEFFLSGTLTEKSDVYAFGITLLELLTGRKPIDYSLPPEQQSLVNWAAPQLTNRNKLPKLVAPHIQEDLNLKHLYQVAAVAALCVQREPSYRPLIVDVVQSLLPLVPVELGGTLRSDTKSSAESSLSSSHRHVQQHDILKIGSESFTFAGEVGVLDFDLPPDISSAASSGEIHAANKL